MTSSVTGPSHPHMSATFCLPPNSGTISLNSISQSGSKVGKKKRLLETSTTLILGIHGSLKWLSSLLEERDGGESRLKVR
jgi:hypothetical protein